MNAFVFYGMRNDLNKFKRELKELGLKGGSNSLKYETASADGRLIKTWKFDVLVPKDRIEEARELHRKHLEKVGFYRI